MQKNELNYKNLFQYNSEKSFLKFIILENVGVF
jgi:hypothetical protein